LKKQITDIRKRDKNRLQITDEKKKIKYKGIFVFVFTDIRHLFEMHLS